MCVYLETKFQVTSIILTSFRQGVIFPSSPLPPPKNPTPKKKKPRLGLKNLYASHQHLKLMGTQS